MDFTEKNTGRRRIFDIIQTGNHYDITSLIFDLVLTVMIFVNLSILILETYDSMLPYEPIFKKIEFVTIIFFTIEYFLRLFTADFLYPELSRPKAILSFIFSFYGFIDLMTILPYYLPLFLPVGFVAFRILRVFRVLRLFRVNLQYDAFNVVMDVLKKKRKQLFSSIVMILVMMLASSIVMYSIEHEAQPDVFQNAFSGIWWSVSTLLTVGYGDIYPITTLGKTFSIIITFLGVGLVAIPTGIISAGFVEQYQTMRSFAQSASGNDMSFIMLSLESDHPWCEKAISQCKLPPDLLVITVIRNDEVIIPRGNTILKMSDTVILGAPECNEDIGVALKEFTITPNHPWRDKLIKDIRLDKNTILVSVVRNEETKIPKGNLQIRLGDMVTICIRKR